MNRTQTNLALASLLAALGLQLFIDSHVVREDRDFSARPYPAPPRAVSPGDGKPYGRVEEELRSIPGYRLYQEPDYRGRSGASYRQYADLWGLADWLVHQEPEYSGPLAPRPPVLPAYRMDPEQRIEVFEAAEETAPASRGTGRLP